MIGYCHHLAERHPKAYCTLLAKLLPMQISGDAAPGARISTVNIVSVPSNHFLSPADIERLKSPGFVEQMQSAPTLEQAEPEHLQEASVAIEPAPAEPELDPIMRRARE